MPVKTKNLEPVVLEGMRIVYRNFAGREERFNSLGDRNFNVILPEDLARDMEKDGWMVKWQQPREEGDLPRPILKVKVKYTDKAPPPRIVLITSRGKTPLDESMVELLDWAEIIDVDMILRPRKWEIGGREIVTAYLRSLYVTIRQDELEEKYFDVPDSVRHEPEE